METKKIGRTLMAVHAHPDDECITTGGILARYNAEGARTVVVTCTRGDLGGISDPTLAGPLSLDDLRARELARALDILGGTRSVQLGYRDSGMAGAPANAHPDSFHQADLEEATRRLVRVVREERPDVLVTYDETGGYGHPDHVKAHQVTVAAFKAAGDPDTFPEVGAPWSVAKLYFVVFSHAWVDYFVQTLRAAGIDAPSSAPAGIDAGAPAGTFGIPDELVTTVVDVAAYAATKRAALAAHGSQLGPDHFLMRIPPELVPEVWSHEHFRRAAGPTAASPDQPESDLFGGLV